MNGQHVRQHGAFTAKLPLVAAFIVGVLSGCASSGPPQATLNPTLGPRPTAVASPRPTPTPSSASTLSPTPSIQNVMALQYFAPLDPGSYFIDPDLDPSTPLRVVYEVPAEGWSMWIGAAKFNDDGHVGVSITTVANLVTDGCRDHSWADPPVGPTVDDLAAALADLAPFRVTSPPTDVTIYGYSGKHLAWTVPDLPVEGEGDARRFAGCRDGNLKSWVAAIDADDPLRSDAYYGYTGPGYVEEFWILDVDGTRLMIVAEQSPGAPAQDLAERDAILDSIRIEPQPTAVASPTASAFATTAFAAIREDPVSQAAAAEFQAILNHGVGATGMTATVMTADGTWSGAAGTADGVRDMRPDDQLAIGSVTKSVIAAQVMQLIDSGLPGSLMEQPVRR
jgi:hypothetical protein